MMRETRTIGSDAGRLQTLFVRLLFCDITYERYRTDRPGLARDFGVALAACDQLPAPETPQLLAERHGRKTGVLNEIRKTFGQSYRAIEALPDYSFVDFLCSDAFFDDDAGLPHPYGVGPGYENTSKFFFWVRSTLNLDGAASDDADRRHTRLMLNGDLAAYLIDQHARGAHDYYRRFANGIYWRESPAAARPVILMTAQLDVYRIGNDNRYGDRLSGAFDLDTLTPEKSKRARNIL